LEENVGALKVRLTPEQLGRLNAAFPMGVRYHEQGIHIAMETHDKVALVTGAGHDVGSALVGGRQLNHGAGFEQLVNLRERQILHHVCDSWTRPAKATN
jgi:hypothetical protein